MVSRFSGFLVCCALFLASGAAYAETGRDVMDRVYKQADIFPNSEAEVRLVVKNKKGDERERFFYLRAKNDPTTKKSLVKFFKPANVKGVGLASETVFAGMALDITGADEIEARGYETPEDSVFVSVGVNYLF
jgi:hypothetical protein